MKNGVTFRRICLILFCVTIITSSNFVVFAVGNNTTFAGGDGSESNPYLVATPEQLNEVRNHLDAYFIQINDIDLTEATAEGGMFYNGGDGWEPIGTDYYTSFEGSYDGGGHRIIGLKSKQSYYGGLFGINKGIVQNLGMDNGTVSPSYSSSSNPPSNPSSFAGGIVRSNSGIIINCYNTGAVSSSDSYSYVGGIAGDNSGTIINCYNTGVVSGSITGGISGDNSGTIRNCYNTGAVSSSYVFSFSCAGGIAGDNYDGIIESCYNTGAVSSSGASSCAGGIVGNNDNGTIINCYFYNAPNLKAEGGVALTVDALKSQVSLEGFDFETVWYFDSDSYYPFPLLQSMGISAEKEENYYDFDGGTGRLENPYKVSTPEQFDNVRKYLNAYYIQTNDIDLTAATAEDGRFYNGGDGWEPIGIGYDTAFEGSYDGGGHCVIGLKSKRYLSGLFGYNRGVIQNLSIVDSSMSSSSSHVGGIACRNYGAIKNCYNAGTVLSLNSPQDIGGITGINYGTIENCYNSGAVSGITSSAGGIAGDNAGGIIINCYNIGTLSGSSHVGGIAGINSGSIENCYNTGTVSSLSGWAGGISGGNSGTIINCYNTGKVSCSFFGSYSGSVAGGIVGDNAGGTIANSYNTGEVYAEGYAGGIVGYVVGDRYIGDDSIKSCYNTGEIIAISNSRSVYAGGIAGYSGPNITDVFNTGNIKSQTTGAGKYAYAGGIVGYTKYSNLSYGYSTGTVQGTPQYTGKVVGNNEDGTFSRLYFIGAYEDLGVGNEDNGKDRVEFKTEAQMKQQATYVDFDFDTVWHISPDKNSGYPILQGLPAPEDVGNMPLEPSGNDVSITLSEKSYDVQTGTYSLTVTLQNQATGSVSGTVILAVYNDGRVIGVRKYAVTLSQNGTQTVPAKITTNGKVDELKAFYWDMDSIRPLGNAAEIVG